MYKQDPPNCIQIELVEGCNLYCNFCGMQGIREKGKVKYNFMSKATMRHIAFHLENIRFQWNPRIELALHGEPTMHPNLFEIITILRNKFKGQIMMTSNGGGLLMGGGPAQNLEWLFEAGVDIVALDKYDGIKIVDKIEKKIPSARSYAVHYYPQEKEISPHNRYPKGMKKLIIVQDISVADKGTHSKLNNHCGLGAPLDFSVQGKKCAKVFREMSIVWNGDVTLCCNDFSNRVTIGNVNKNNLEEIWQDKLFHSYRKYLYHGKRDLIPCYGCNAISYRTGLLPDRMGKQTLPEPTNKDKKLIESSIKRVKIIGAAAQWQPRKQKR